MVHIPPTIAVGINTATSFVTERMPAVPREGEQILLEDGMHTVARVRWEHPPAEPWMPICYVTKDP